MSLGGLASSNTMGGFGGIGLLFAPLIYGAIGFIMTAISCAVYNLVAGWTGGIEVEIDVESITTDENVLG